MINDADQTFYKHTVASTVSYVFWLREQEKFYPVDLNPGQLHISPPKRNMKEHMHYSHCQVSHFYIYGIHKC